jgi:hypothetical protein
MNEGQEIELFDLSGRKAKIGDYIEFATTEGNVLRHKIIWDAKLLCVSIGGFPYSRLMDSGYIQSAIVGKKHLDFNIL